MIFEEAKEPFESIVGCYVMCDKFHELSLACLRGLHEVEEVISISVSALEDVSEDDFPMFIQKFL